MSFNFCIRKLVQVSCVVIKVFYINCGNRRFLIGNLRLRFLFVLYLWFRALLRIIKGLFGKLRSLITFVLLSLLTEGAFCRHLPEVILRCCLFLAVFGNVGEDSCRVGRLFGVLGCLLVKELASWFGWRPNAFLLFLWR